MKTVLFYIAFLMTVSCYSQQDHYSFCSRYNSDITNKDTLSFFNDLENKISQKISDMAKTKSWDVMTLDGIFTDWLVAETPEQIIRRDSLLNKTMTNAYETYLIWNNFQDTGQFMGFSRIYNGFTFDYRNNKIDFTSPIITIPLGEYHKFLDNTIFLRFKNIMHKHFVDKFQLDIIDSTTFLYEYIINKDSLVLNHAPLCLFLDQLDRNPYLIDKPFIIYSDKTLAKQLSNNEIDERTSISQNVTFMGRDTTLLLLASIIDLKIYEEWKIIPNVIETNPEYITPLFTLVRRIKTVGVRYETDKELFYDFDEIDKTFNKTRINFDAYKELFKSYSSTDLKIEIRYKSQK